MERRRTRPAAVLVAAAVLVLVSGCAARPPFEAVPAADRIDAEDWGPHHVPMEWWYVSGVSPESRLAFHVAFFRAYTPEDTRVLGIRPRALMTRPVHVAHVAVTDLAAGTHVHDERRSLRGRGGHASDPPLRVGLRNWTLRENARDGTYRLRAGPVDLVLEPRKPRVVHPPGHSGTPATGRLVYQSVTRLSAAGTVGGRRFAGSAWMDHQWGDQMPSRSAVWDWCGLHDQAQGVDVMLYRVRDLRGRVVQRFGTVTDASGTVYALEDVEIDVTQRWRSPTGRRHDVALAARAEAFEIRTEPLRLEQEILSPTARLVYWEGPVRFEGRWRGRPLKGHGTFESVYGK